MKAVAALAQDEPRSIMAPRTSQPRTPRAPSHLRPSTRRWWSRIAGDYVLRAQDVELLTLAAEALDRGAEARERMAKDGTFILDRFGKPRAHPAVAIERDSRIAFARLVRELNLDDEDPAPERLRPPRLR